MSVLVTGSIGIDTVETPQGRAEHVPGGSAMYFSLAAALFTRVRLVGVVGEDFDRSWLQPLEQRGVDTSGVEVRRGSRTFRWHGRYGSDPNERQTVDVQLNVLAEAPAKIPAEFRDSRYVFLANTHPGTQADFARDLPHARLIVADTMDLWIESQPDALRDMLRLVHGLVLNDGEARLLSGQNNLLTAARRILDLGPRFVIVKKGEHGSLLVSHDDLFVLPAYPTEKVVDPTGCGDTFAGAMMGYLAAADRDDPQALRSAMARGTVVASIVLESFSIDALLAASPDDVQGRLERLRHAAEFS